jgi:hypothetical protein
MAFQNNPPPTKPAASGAAGRGSEPKSKTPGNMQRVLGRDEQGRVPLGNNQYAGPSSITDVTRTPAMDGIDLRAQHGDDAIDVVKAKGMGSNYQMRSIDAAQYPTTPGMRNRSGEGGTIPLSSIRKANDGIIRPTRR